MALPDVFTRYRPAIDAGLRQALDGGASDLYAMLRYHMGWLDEEGRPTEGASGKAVRPALCLFACEAAGGVAEQALPAAVAIELVHNFSLIHDDIQDGDTERHHHPTVWYRWGHSHGVNAGDAMFVLGHQALIASDGLAPRTALAVSRILTRACAEMIEGQVLDLTFEQRASVGVEEYLRMIGKKTGALLEGSLHMGAVIGCEDPATIEAMRCFGNALGLLFQVRDDMLGVWGVAERTGKPVGSDIHRRKKSLPIVHALETAEGAGRERLVEIYRKDAPLDEADIESVLGVLADLGTQQVCEAIADKQADRSVAELDTVELSPKARRECEELTQFLLKRDY